MGRVRRDAGTLRQEGALPAAAAAAAALPAVRGGRGAASAITTSPTTSPTPASPRLARHRLFHPRPGPRRPLQVDWALLLPVLCFHYLDAKKRNFLLLYLLLVAVTLPFDLVKIAAMDEFAAMGAGAAFDAAVHLY